MELLFHYTTGDIIKQIIGLGVINPSKNEPTNLKEKATVMFSSNPDWEHSRYQVYQTESGQPLLMGKNLLEQYGGGLFRISVKPEIAPVDWKELKMEAYIKQDVIQAVYNFALDVGAKTSEWFFTFEAVPEAQWESIEKYLDGKWISLEDIDDNSMETEDEKQNDLEWQNSPSTEGVLVVSEQG